ncbi:AraC family transcriptional regulator [Flavitalea flava]
MKAELVVDAPILGQKRIWVKKIYKPYFDHPFHYHQLCELVWLEKGHGKFIIGDYVGNFSEGELILKNAGLPHLWRCDSVFYQEQKDLFTKATTTYFPPAIIPAITDDAECISRYANLLNKADRGLRFYGKSKKQIIELIKKLAASEGFEQLGYFLLVIDVITRTEEFEYLASIGYKNSHKTEDMDRFNEVYQYLLQHFDSDIMLGEVALICNMAPSSFCRYFKKRTQKTFTRFLNELRIGHACKLLQNEEYSVQNICYECGYNSPVNFFKFFKLITNKTPQEYRQYIKKMGEGHLVII